MKYIHVQTAEPFAIVCDGAYQAQLAYQRLDRDPFSFTKITEHNGPLPAHVPEITLTAFLKLHR